MIKQSLWKEYFWSRSYCLVTTGGAPIEIVREYIIVEALVAGVNPQMAERVANAESRFNCGANGDGNKSHGCWQIYLPAHPEITKTQAHDIIWSTQWSLNEMKKNGCGIWSVCNSVMKSL